MKAMGRDQHDADGAIITTIIIARWTRVEHKGRAGCCQQTAHVEQKILGVQEEGYRE
jgi:hypothetical protein